MPDSVDVEQYLERIGLRGPVRPDLETLNTILFAHATTVPFENLDVLLGRPIELTPDALFQKIVVRRRGGYCFEQNGLLLHLFRTIGFTVTPLSARVRYQRPREYTPPRTHLFLRVEIDDVPWVADCGVGSMSLTGAFRFDLEGEQRTPHEPRRIIRENGVFFHQVRLGDAWHDVLEFTGEEMHPIDRELANWYTSAHPLSHFKSRLVAARALADGGRLSLLNRELTRRGPDGQAVSHMLRTPAELLVVLEREFGMHFPADTLFRCDALDWPAAADSTTPDERRADA